MNNPNPFIPQGSLLQQKNRKRTRFQVAVFSIFAFNILVITPMLIQGCKRDSSADAGNPTPPVDTGAPVAAATPDTNNAGVAALPTPTNPVVTPTAPPPPPPPVANTAGTEYVIVKGDTLDAIHKKFNVTVKAIEDANPGLVPTKLQPGHKIMIPPASAAPAATAAAAGSATVAADGSELYVVKSGDSLSKIATNHHTSVKAIQTLNNLKTTRINVGDKLKMPPPSAPATPPAPAAPAPAAPAAPAAPTAPPQ